MKQSISQHILQSMGLQDEALPWQTVVEILGTERVLVENHCGVTEYDTNCVMVQGKDGLICVYGRNLRLSRMMRQQLIICGQIEQIKLPGICEKRR